MTKPLEGDRNGMQEVTGQVGPGPLKTDCDQVNDAHLCFGLEVCRHFRPYHSMEDVGCPCPSRLALRVFCNTLMNIRESGSKQLPWSDKHEMIVHDMNDRVG